MLRPRLIVFVTCVLFAGSVYAQDGVRVSLTPVPWLVQGEAAAPADAGPSTVAATDTLVYGNTNINYFSPLAWFPAGAGVTVADDVHMLKAGRITQLFFSFYEPVSVVVRPTVTLYANQDDISLGSILAGPYALGPYRWGAYNVRLTFSTPVPLEANLWFALSFDSATAGTVMANPPFAGTSNVTYYNFTSGQPEQLSGSEGPVPSNFYLKIHVEKEPVAVHGATWSQIKALYRPARGARLD